MPLTLNEAVDQLRETHYAFPPPRQTDLDVARARGVPEALLGLYELCDGALIGEGDDFSDPTGRRYRLRIPRLSKLQTTQSSGYIFDDSPLYDSSADWWQIVDYGDANWLVYDATRESTGRIIDVFHETTGEPGYQNIVANSITDLLERLLKRGGVYWFDDDFVSLGAV